MKDWIIEYKEYWFDCNVENEELTLNVVCETEEEAIKKGKELLKQMDSKDNNSGGSGWSDDYPMVSRTFYRCVETKNHVYNSSVKEPQLNGFQGYTDVVKWNGL